MDSGSGRSWKNIARGQGTEAGEGSNKYELLAWIKASDHREDILTTLNEGPENTSYFKSKWDIATADVPRRYIKDLQNRGLVKCLTPERERYRLYGLSSEGEQIVEEL
jgi:predicted transcriptional regulator